MMDDDDLQPSITRPRIANKRKNKREEKKDLLLLKYYRLFMNCKSVS
jgi:hypothetical protein